MSAEYRVLSDESDPCSDSSPSARYSVLGTQHSSLITRHSSLRTRYSSLITRYSALSTQYSALSTLECSRMDRERRQAPRSTLSELLQIKVGVQTARVVDLSTAGARVEHEEKLTVNSNAD